MRTFLHSTTRAFTRSNQLASSGRFQNVTIRAVFSCNSVGIGSVTVFRRLDVIQSAITRRFVGESTGKFQVTIVTRTNEGHILFVGGMVVASTVRLTNTSTQFGVQFSRLRRFNDRSTDSTRFFSVF